MKGKTEILSHEIAEWDLGGLPAWLLELKPSVKLRSSNAQFLNQVCNFPTAFSGA